MKKIYLAGPMTGLPDLNFPAFHKKAAALRRAGFEVFNPAELGDIDLRQAFAADLLYICRDATTVALLPGWRKSFGAKIEHDLAARLDLEIVELDRNPHEFR